MCNSLMTSQVAWFSILLTKLQRRSTYYFPHTPLQFQTMEIEGRNEAARLWKVFRTIHEMVRDRGYLVSQAELEMDLKTFQDMYATNGEVE